MPSLSSPFLRKQPKEYESWKLLNQWFCLDRMQNLQISIEKLLNQWFSFEFSDICNSRKSKLIKKNWIEINF